MLSVSLCPKVITLGGFQCKCKHRVFYHFSLAEKIKSEEDRLCVERLGKDIAIVEIHFSTPFVMRMKQDVRKTFTDKISDIGEP